MTTRVITLTPDLTDLAPVAMTGVDHDDMEAHPAGLARFFSWLDAVTEEVVEPASWRPQVTVMDGYITAS